MLPGHLVIWLTPPPLWTQGWSWCLIQVSSLRSPYEPTEHAYGSGRREEGDERGEGGREGGAREERAEKREEEAGRKEREAARDSLHPYLPRHQPDSPNCLSHSTDAIPARVLLINGVHSQCSTKSPTAPLPGMSLSKHRETLAPKVALTFMWSQRPVIHS